MSKYIDAHCHLTNSTDLESVISRAESMGVVAAINNAAQFSDWADVIDIANKYHQIYGAIGIHPWYVSDAPDDYIDIMWDILIKNKNIQVGEIGLDKKHPALDRQIDFLKQQLSVAHKLNRGVSLHCVGAWDELFAILKEYKRKMPPFIILHAYNGPCQNLSKISQEYNPYVSFGKHNINNRHISEYLNNIPRARILVESDDNAPGGIINTVQTMAQILNLDHENLADIIYQNSKRILNHG